MAVAIVGLGVGTSFLLYGAFFAPPSAYFPAPRVATGTPVVSSDGVAVNVTTAHPERGLNNWSVKLSYNGTAVEEIDPLASTGGKNNLRFLDVDGDGRLSAGDRFVIKDTTPGNYTLTISYDGDVVDQSAWSIP